jgi:hypothetical protein
MLRRHHFYISQEGEPGKICCGAWTPAGAALAERGWPLERSCGASTPARAAPAERGRPPELRLRGVDARRSHSGGFWPL